MKVKRNVLILTIALSTFGFVKAKAEEPTVIKPQPSQPSPTKAVVEAEEPTSVLTSINQTSESQDQELFYYDSNFADNMSNANLSFQLNYQPDSIDYNDVQYYIKKIMPIVKSIDSKKLEMIEIL